MKFLVLYKTVVYKQCNSVQQAKIDHCAYKNAKREAIYLEEVTEHILDMLGVIFNQGYFVEH